MSPKQDGTGAAVVDRAYPWIPVDANTPRGSKLQLIVKADGVALHGQYQPGTGWTHWAPLPTFSNDEEKS